MSFGSLEKTNTNKVSENKTIEKPTIATVKPKSTELANKILSRFIAMLFITEY